MVSQLGEEIKTQNVEPRSKVGIFSSRNRAAVFDYLGSERLVDCAFVYRIPDVLGICPVPYWSDAGGCAVE